MTDAELVARVAAGDEDAFAGLVERHHPALVRLARLFLPSPALAEELVQDSWMAALEQLSGFERRASFKAWMVAIVSNRARNLASRERVVVPLSSLTGEDSSAGPAVSPERFEAGGLTWARPPLHWSPDMPDLLLRRAQAREALLEALEALPPGQRAVVTLRDVEGLSAEEVCQALSLTDANQRVLLHRGRSRLRNLLEGYADGI